MITQLDPPKMFVGCSECGVFAYRSFASLRSPPLKLQLVQWFLISQPAFWPIGLEAQSRFLGRLPWPVLAFLEPNKIGTGLFNNRSS